MNDDMNPDSQVLNDRDANIWCRKVRSGAARRSSATPRVCARSSIFSSKSESNANAGLTEVLERGERSRKGQSRNAALSRRAARANSSGGKKPRRAGRLQTQ